MGLNVTGKAQVCNKKELGKIVAASLRISRKNKEGEWESSFVDCKFVGRAAEKAANLQPKEYITLTEAQISVDEVEKDGKKNKYTRVVIFDFATDLEKLISDEIPF